MMNVKDLCAQNHTTRALTASTSNPAPSFASVHKDTNRHRLDFTLELLSYGLETQQNYDVGIGDRSQMMSAKMIPHSWLTSAFDTPPPPS